MIIINNQYYPDPQEIETIRSLWINALYQFNSTFKEIIVELEPEWMNFDNFLYSMVSKNLTYSDMERLGIVTDKTKNSKSKGYSVTLEIPENLYLIPENDAFIPVWNLHQHCEINNLDFHTENENAKKLKLTA